MLLLKQWGSLYEISKQQLCVKLGWHYNLIFPDEGHFYLFHPQIAIYMCFSKLSKLFTATFQFGSFLKSAIVWFRFFFSLTNLQALNNSGTAGRLFFYSCMKRHKSRFTPSVCVCDTM